MPLCRLPKPRIIDLRAARARRQCNPWEIAVTDLRDALPDDLDSAVRAWLEPAGFGAIRRCAQRGRFTVYNATFGEEPFTIPVRIGVHQRANRLQLHHLDAFAGLMLRERITAGMLVTTGEVAREARQASRGSICLLNGREWAADAASRRTAFPDLHLPGWTVRVSRRRPRRSP